MSGGATFWIVFAVLCVAASSLGSLLIALLICVRRRRKRLRATAVRLEDAFAEHDAFTPFSARRHGCLGCFGGGRVPLPRPSRWCTLVSCIWAATASGLLYTFSVYSSALKHRFNLSQRQLAMTTAVPRLAQLLAFVPGLVNDLNGPRATLLIGGGASAASYFALWALTREVLGGSGGPLVPLYASSNRIAAVLTVVNSAAALGSSFVSAATFATVLKAFPARGAAAAGLVQGWVGLGGGVATQLFVGWVANPDDSPRTLDFVLLLAVGCVVATLCATPGMHVHGHGGADNATDGEASPSPHVDGERRARRRCAVCGGGRMAWLYAMTVGTLAFVTASALLPAGGDARSARGAARLAVSCTIALLCVAPLGVALAPASCRRRATLTKRTAFDVVLVDILEQRLLEQQRAATEARASDDAAALDGAKEADADEDTEGDLEGRSVHPLKMLLRWECWALLWSTGCIVGGGAMLLVNLGQICESNFARPLAYALGVNTASALSAAASLAAAAVTVFSVAQTLGRAFTGLVADALLGGRSRSMKMKGDRVAGIALAAALMAAAHGLLALAAALSDRVLPGPSLNVTGSAAASAVVTPPLYDGGVSALSPVGLVEALLLVGVSAAGLAFGAMWPLLVVTVRDLWGLRYYAVNFMVFDGVTAGAFSIVFGMVMPCAVYTKRDALLPNAEFTCLGGDCFLAAHLVIVVLCATAALVATALTWRATLRRRLCSRKRNVVVSSVVS